MTPIVERARPRATWPVASGSFVAGFAVAEATGVRQLGGVVLAAGIGWCVLHWRRTIGIGMTLVLLANCVVFLVLAHLIADVLGTWPAVFIVAADAALSVLVMADLPAWRAGNTD